MVVVRLNESDVGEILSAADRCLSARTHDDFVDAVVASVGRLVGSDLVTYNEVDSSVPRIIFRSDPVESFSPDLMSAFLYHLDDHPVITQMRRSGSGAATRISDAMNVREFHNHGIYSDFFHQLGVEDQVAISLRMSATHIIGVAANRDRAFSDTERDRLEMLRPLLASAYHNLTRLGEVERSAEYLRAGLSGAGCDVFVLSADGSVVECTDGALERLAAALPRGTVERETDFLARLASGAQRPRWEASGARWWATSTRIAVGTIVTIRRDGLPHASELQATLQVSAREAQVLALIAEGRASAEVARTLGISVRTVHKHLEHLYRCLGVSSRSEALTIARSVAESTHGGS